jgi:ATP-binding cassette subfamily B (MDR/TAP) protein 1
MVFFAILKQDVAFFDDENHATGILTARLSTDAQKIQGLTGVTLGTIFQISSTLIGAIVIAFIYGWQLALVGIAVIPFLVLAGAFRLKVITYFAEKSKQSYERSAQLACESVAAIKTVQSLTRERDVHSKYMQMLENPLKDGFKNAWTNTLLYAFSQSTNFMVNSLVFWYGGRLIVEYTMDLKSFFTVFMVS